MKHLNTIGALISAFCFPISLWGIRESRFQELLVPIDLYTVPKDIKKTMKMRDLYKAIADQGLIIRVAQKDYYGAQLKHFQTYRKYYPTPTLSTGYNYSQTVSTGTITNKQAYTLGNTIALESPWGFNLSFDLPKFEQDVSRTGGATTTSNTVSLGTSLTVKLLKGAPYLVGDITATAADLDLLLAKLTLKSTALSTLKSGEEAFYDVILKRLRAKVLSLALESSRALLDDVIAMRKAGEGDKLSIIKVELQLAQTETDYLSAQADSESAMQNLRDIISLNEDGASIFPDPSEVKDSPPLPDLGVANNIKKAKKSRPDYLSAIFNLRKAKLSERKAHTDTLPSVDLTAGYGYSGSANSFSAAISHQNMFAAPSYSIGVTVSHPLWNNPAREDYLSAKIETQKKELAIQQLNTQIAKEVVSALHNVELGYRRLKTSLLAKTLSEKKLAAEYIKFKVGDSSIRNIVDFQTEVNNSRISELSARVDYLKGLSALRNSLGVYPANVTSAEINNGANIDVED